MHRSRLKHSWGWRQFATPLALSHPEQLLAGIFASPNVGFFISDDQLRCQAINHALAAINGLSPEAHLGKTVREFLGGAATAVEPLFEYVLATGQPLLNHEVSATLPTRTEVGHWIGNYFPVKDASGRVRQVGVVVVEITREKAVVQESVRRTSVRRTSASHRLSGDVAPSTGLDRLIGRRPDTDILRSWKEIAGFLAASVRTAQRWEGEYQLPVRRLQTQKGASVFAFGTDLENWLRTNRHP